MVQVVEKPDWVTWDDIHEVIWKAHESNRLQGINMKFPALPGEEIRKRVECNGKMYVALDGNKVVGTAAIRTKKASLWCGKGEYAYLCFASVLPEYSGQGIYKQLYIHIERESIKNGFSRVMFDTHENNTRIAEINLKHGYKKVSYKRYDDHYNIIFVKWLEGCPYSDGRCKVEFAIQKLKEKVKTFIRRFNPNPL
jgi:ribosomal protein S18 acetylase RimI-like enzyme